MSELLRFHTPRNPEAISKENFNLIAIDSHPAKYRSDHFIKWLRICSSRDYAVLKQQMTSFLKSKDSITSINDYKDDASHFLESALSKGENITEEDIIKLLREGKFLKEQRLLFDAITRTSDTLLALVFLNNTSCVKDINYQDILKLLFYVDHIASQPKQTLQINLKDYLGKQIMLPPCYFHLNPCSKKIESKESFFLLDDTPQPPREPLYSNGCIEIISRCECVPDDNCVPQNPCCATITPYITDLMVVREEVTCYVPGELSYIENILTGEDRTREHRHLERTEEYVEQEKEISNYVERDTQQTERFALKKETDETIKQDLALDAGVTYTAKYGTAVAGTSLSTNFSASYDWSKSITRKVARDYSKDIINRALTKVEEKMRELVTRKYITETEEKNKHGFNNTQGDDNISGQYFYVNKVSRAQVFNYGKRMVCDILVPEPSELYKRLLAKQFKFDLTEPVEPTETPETITVDNYRDLMQKYGLKDCESPPDMNKSYSMHIEAVNCEKPNKKPGQIYRTDLKIIVPPDYITESMSCKEFVLIWWKKGGISWSLGLGGQSLYHSKNHSEAGETCRYFIKLDPLEGEQPLTFQTFDVTRYDILLTVNYVLKEEVLLKWKTGIYDKIIEVYERQKKEYDEAYNKALEEFENNNKAAKYNRNPFLNRETERIALKQMAISYISCSFYDEMNAMKHKVRPCGFPQMDLEETEKEGHWVQFFEQAFEWPLMTYLFYPYFWGRKCTWVDKMKEEAADPIFEKFLQSGFAKLQVPVRPGFEELIEYFLGSGDIWEDSDAPPLPGVPYYVSMAQEIREERGNFYADREGTLAYDSSVAKNIFTLTEDTKHNWYNINNVITQQNIKADIDREIIIDCKVYRIISITETSPPHPDHRTWIITIDRDYEGEEQQFKSMKWSTGAVYIGAPWEFITPTQLVWLGGKAKCLPCYPIECKE